MWRVNKATIGVGAVLVAVMIVYSFYHIKDMSDQSTQNYLRLYASSIYEYHALTGKWPSKIDDLARTSLALQYPHWWKAQLDTEADVIVWPKDMKPDPKDNGRILLAYHNKGLDAEMGRMWVCWGDLRTEWITPEDLRHHLQNRKD
jgi:type II secretory pathway pseudopilin PulG